MPRLKITDAVTGEVLLLELDALSSVRAAPGAIYSFADERGYNAEVPGLAVSRRGQTLTATVDGEPLVRFEGFFAPGAEARLRVVDPVTASGVWTVDSREADALPDEDDDDGAGAVLWPLTSSPATLAAEVELADALSDGSGLGALDGIVADDAATVAADGTATGGDPGGDPAAGQGLSRGAKIGIGAGLGVGALAAFGAGSGGGGNDGEDAPPSRSGAPTIEDGRTVRMGVNEREAFVVDLEADEPVSWSIVAGELDAAAFGIDADGVLGFLVPPEVDAGEVDTYGVLVEATDADGESTVERVDVTVFDRDGFDEGELGEGGGGEDGVAQRLTVPEGATGFELLEREGADYWELRGPDAEAFVLRRDDDDPPGTYELHFDPENPRSVASPSDADGDNVYEVRVQPWSEGTEEPYSVGEPRTLSIEVVERTVSLGIRENDSLVSLEGGYFDDAFSAEPPAIVGGDDADRFRIDADGRLAFVDAPDFESPLDADGDNVYELRLSVDGREGTARVQVVDLDEGERTERFFEDAPGLGTVPAPDDLPVAALPATLDPIGVSGLEFH